LPNFCPDGRHRTRLLALVAIPAAFFTAATVALPTARPSQVDAGVLIERDVVYGRASGERLLLDAYLPRGGRLRPAIVYFHGGGFRAGDKAYFAPGEQAFAPSALRLVRLGFAVFSVNYRLEPPAPFPAAIVDALRSVRWLRAHARSFGVDPARLASFGASAGGNLAALVATIGRGPLDRSARVRAAVSWSGPMDLGLFDRELAPSSGSSFIERYMGCSQTVCPSRYAFASPVDHVDRSDPPLLLANGTAEIVPLAQAREMSSRLAAAHVPHDLLVVPGSRHAAEYDASVWARTVRFLLRNLPPRREQQARGNQERGLEEMTAQRHHRPMMG
jgi:acetyl esterase